MRWTGRLLAGAALLAGCGGESPPTERTATASPREDASFQALPASVEQDLATLRRATASFQTFENARAAGWSAQITPCMSDPTAGAMGFHYGKGSIIDGTVRVDEPELLLYEPQKNGRLRLVAVEYIIPYDFHPRSAEPPVLFGQKFQQVDAFQLWGLHAWVWAENPSGMFAPWNPKVTCENTSAVSTMSHN
jgi:hypothetical protein